ncbi:MAG: hypothetical protein Q8L48_24550 [Archangium sp.]|nr:hypothetical protein [Archangium sp.]
MRSNTTQALILGVTIGFVLAVFPSCGPTRPPLRCNASNCDGCCDDTASCFKGTSTEACGAGGASCSVCAGGQMCAKIDQNAEFGGRCTGTGVGGGGGGATGGGTGGGSTGGGTGGGATGGGSGNDGGTCNATSCANGCCTAAGVCITTTTPSRCGAGGATCSSCMMGNTCVSGTCTPCTGCIDINTGACQAGTSDTQCGKMGGFCQTCDSAAGQTCQGGTCFGGTTCNASTCMGCCDGNNCMLPAMYTNAQCGQGAFGAACTTCLSGATCDALDAGACVGGGGTGGGGGGGFPGLDGGLTFDICALNGLPCPANKCCQPIAAALSATGSSCVSDGAACDLGFSGSCVGATQTCQ